MRKFSQFTTTLISQPAKAGSVLAAIAAVGLIAACSDATGTSLSSHSTLAFSIGAPASGAAAALAPDTVGGHVLDLTAASLTIARAELKVAPSDTCAGDEGDDDNAAPASSFDKDGGNGGEHEGNDGCAEVKIDSTTVDLPLSGDVVMVPADAIPPGTYTEIELRVSQVVLAGTFDGTAFSDTIPVHAKAEIRFDTPVVVTAGTPTSITVNVPVNTWLVNPDGSLVDPTTLATNQSALEQVKVRIAQSLRAFEDEDHDGHDDHGGHGRD